MNDDDRSVTHTTLVILGEFTQVEKPSPRMKKINHRQPDKLLIKLWIWGKHFHLFIFLLEVYVVVGVWFFSLEGWALFHLSLLLFLVLARLCQIRRIIFRPSEVNLRRFGFDLGSVWLCIIRSLWYGKGSGWFHICHWNIDLYCSFLTEHLVAVSQSLASPGAEVH